jgi:hypothetical protein
VVSELLFGAVADVASAERVACHASRRTLFQTGFPKIINVPGTGLDQPRGSWFRCPAR